MCMVANTLWIHTAGAQLGSIPISDEDVGSVMPPPAVPPRTYKDKGKSVTQTSSSQTTSNVGKCVYNDTTTGMYKLTISYSIEPRESPGTRIC